MKKYIIPIIITIIAVVSFIFTFKDKPLGQDSGIRPTNYKTTLARSLTATASSTETVYVSSLSTKDSHTLTTSDIGGFIVFHINPGSSNDEIIACTGINSTLVAFTGCTRGYGFYTTGAISGNEKAHSSGETVIISNDDAWLKTQYTANNDDETIYGKWTFTTSTTAISKLYLGSEGAYLWYNATANTIGFASSTTSGDYAFNENGITFSTVNPLYFIGGSLGLSTTTAETYFDLDAEGDLKLKFGTNGGLTADTWGIHISTSTPFTWTASHTFNASSTFASNFLLTGNSTSTGKFVFDRMTAKEDLRFFQTGDNYTALKATTTPSAVKTWTLPDSGSSGNFLTLNDSNTWTFRDIVGMGDMDFTTYTTNTNYQASSDGIVSASVDFVSGTCSGAYMNFKIGSSTSATTIIGTLLFDETGNQTNNYGSFPVKKNWWWYVTAAGGGCTSTFKVRFTPLTY